MLSSRSNTVKRSSGGMFSQSSWYALLSTNDGFRLKKPGLGGEEDTGVLRPDGGELSFAEEAAEPFVAVLARPDESDSLCNAGSDLDVGILFELDIVLLCSNGYSLH